MGIPSTQDSPQSTEIYGSGAIKLSGSKISLDVGYTVQVTDKGRCVRDFLVVQWLRIHLPMQGMWVQFLVGELRFPHATQQLTHNKEPMNGRGNPVQPKNRKKKVSDCS